MRISHVYGKGEKLLYTGKLLDIISCRYQCFYVEKKQSVVFIRNISENTVK